MLKDKLKNDYRSAMKARDTVRKDILSYVLALLQTKEIDVQKELSDEDVMQLLKKEIKTRRESLSYMETAGKHDERVEEEAKIAILQSYLPTMLTAEQLEVLIKELIEREGIADLNKERGKLIGLLMNDHRASIDGQLMNEVINGMVKN